MPTFRVHITKVVSTAIDVEADSAEQAAADFESSPDMPGAMVYGAFGPGASVDEAGEWEAVSVRDQDNNEVWREPSQ